MSQHPSPTPLTIVEQVYEAFGRKDLDAALALCHPDVVVTQDPAVPWGGRFVGPEGAATFFIGLVGAIDSVVTTEGLFQAGDQVVQFGRTRGTVRATGAAFDVPECHLWTVRGDRVAEAAFFIDSDAMLQALATG